MMNLLQVNPGRELIISPRVQSLVSAALVQANSVPRRSTTLGAAVRDDESVASESRARTDNLAQVSRIRLGESDEGPPKPHCAKGRPGDLLELRDDESVASETRARTDNLAQARGVSPKRDPVMFTECSIEPSPRRRGGSPERARLA
ncbi:hypothetical protein DEO72_LG8g2774 [Vigna unguiculata]|uniref:Uncharacterized protein n=1 Tax=Vigna unguiculata TaxID=3917 RepID=A0A4D6MTD4_VIGUN|nr:hypothetical protein DEO72_LG8g2774 [Vigna unguiculata]